MATLNAPSESHATNFSSSVGAIFHLVGKLLEGILEQDAASPLMQMEERLVSD
jgi:hypothetical protein